MTLTIAVLPIFLSVPLMTSHYQSWIGREKRRAELISTDALNRFSLAASGCVSVDSGFHPLAHWACFLPQIPDGRLNADGHERLGDFLPCLPATRRMFAGSSIVFERSIEPDAEASLLETIVDVSEKPGNLGSLTFVAVERVISQGGKTRVRERQTYVYREAAKSNTGSKLPKQSETPGDGELWVPTGINLFRFSAATFNAHRIHFDLPYAQTVEAYPALVVQGPFTAAKLAEIAARNGALARFSFRATAPAFADQALRLCWRGNDLVAIRCDGEVVMTAQLGYR